MSYLARYEVSEFQFKNTMKRKLSYFENNLNELEKDIAQTEERIEDLPFLRSLLGLVDVPTNLSGGPLVGNVMMCAGLDAIGKTYESLKQNDLHRGLAHASSGPCLQHNMLVHLEKKQ